MSVTTALPDTAQTLHPQELTALIPLADCYIHSLNTRSEPPPADIEALADSIDAIGLLQNLAGWYDPATPDKLGIVAGGRRLRALQLLASRDDGPAETRVPVKLAPDEDTARTWASAENTARQALHPADEVRAYGRMQREGYFADTIARAFAVTERHVRQRLKLAALPDTALDALRDGSLSLDQAAALTVAPSEDALDAELRRVLTSRWNVAASDIRHQLQRAQIRSDDKRVLLVGLDAYRAAGGAVQEDLFSDQVRLLDEALLDELVSLHMLEAVDNQQSIGWKWVEVLPRDTQTWDAAKGMERIFRHAVPLPEADEVELADLQERGETEELTEAEIARRDELEERAEGDYSDEDIATSGVFLELSHHGKIEVFGPLRRPQDDPNAAPARAGADGKVETKALSNSLLDDLRKIRLAALQLRAATQPELMLDLLAYQISGEVSAYSRALEVSRSDQSVTPEKPDGFEPPSLFDTPTASTGQMTAEGFAAFRALGKKHRNEVLTRALSRALIGHGDVIPALVGVLAPSPREIWTPTATGYFSRLPVPVLDGLWAELVPEDRRADLDFDRKKKAEKAKLLERLFGEADFREALALSRETNARLDAWLPEQLQWPSVEEGA